MSATDTTTTIILSTPKVQRMDRILLDGILGAGNYTLEGPNRVNTTAELAAEFARVNAAHGLYADARSTHGKLALTHRWWAGEAFQGISGDGLRAGADKCAAFVGILAQSRADAAAAALQAAKKAERAAKKASKGGDAAAE